VIFPGQMVARHASQIYEALTEGLLIFIIMNILLYNTNIIFKKGRSSAIFLLLYAVFRSFCEMYREPDAHLGFLIFDLTMGQILSSFMVLIAIIVLYVNRNSKSY
jgi:phosphatidylglycerol:prolipoprotein diacylglycerol transferase